MSKHSFIKILTLVITLMVLLDACKKEELNIPVSADNNENSILNLRWYNSDIETKEEFVKGLKWCFSFLGAKLPQDSWSKGVHWQNDKLLTVDFEKLGFSQDALNVIQEINQVFKTSPEYAQSALDAGSWVVNVFNNSAHYYRIVGMPYRLDSFSKKYIFNPKKAAIKESAVAYGSRIIQLPSHSSALKQAFIAEELDSIGITPEPKEYEVMDVMDNGQLRFGIYSTEGILINGSDPTLTEAGKPAKCLWCHEMNIQPAFAAITSMPGYYSPAEFDSIVKVSYEKLQKYRSGIRGEIDFTKLMAHTLLEKLYFRYMEPSAERLAQEWGLSEEEILKKLIGLKTHDHHEFTEMKDLYWRHEVEDFAPSKPMNFTRTLRETDYSEKSIWK
tara:strand:+ start:14064 stop:15227 length:1164 start_codon:yes stop_codon:yes gene_type:complete